MSEQRTLASVVYDTKGKVTRRERFLRVMDAVIPWRTLRALIEPHYTKPGSGRRPQPLETMLRVYVLQQWFDLSDPQAEDMLYDSEAMRRFARVELGEDTVPDDSTILRFRHLLEQHQLTAAIFDAVKTRLTEKRLLLKAGTIVDATIIAAPSSTKNATQARDPEMKQTRKGQQWHFGMKIHVGTDTRGLVHSLTTTDAAVADISQLTHLVRGSETTLFGDKAYYKTEHQLHWEANGGRYRVNKSGKRTAHGDRINATCPRAREEHHARLRGACTREPVSPAASTDPAGHVVRLRAPQIGRNAQSHPPIEETASDHAATVRERSPIHVKSFHAAPARPLCRVSLALFRLSVRCPCRVRPSVFRRLLLLLLPLRSRRGGYSC